MSSGLMFIKAEHILSRGEIYMRSLERVEIFGYKSIKDLILPLESLNIIIGANGAGKSNFIDIFRLMKEIVNRRLRLLTAKSGGADSLLFYGHQNTDRLRINCIFKNHSYFVSLLPGVDDNFIIKEERINYNKGQDNPIEVKFSSGSKESGLPDFKNKDIQLLADEIIEIITSWHIYHFHDTGESAKVKKTADINDNSFFRKDASNLAPFLYWLKERKEKYYNNIVDTIRLAAPFFGEFILRPSPFNQEKIVLEWKEKNSDLYFNANSLSDGTLRFICLAVLLMQPHPPSLIVIDEPELGLHPYAINLLAGMLKSACYKSQIIVSTQSVSLINQFEPENVIVVDRLNKESVFRRLSSIELSDWLDEYGLGDLWEKNIIGGRPVL